jgi:DNA-binding NarL/FixJ family response regulator
VDDERLLERLGDDALLRDVLQTAPDQNAAALAAAHAELRARRGDAEGATALIGQALARLSDARYLCDALLKCARFGSPGQARQARAAFRRSEICDVSTEAHALLVEAIVKGYDGDAAGRQADAARARTLADGAGLVALKAIAYELEGNAGAAARLYEQMGATRDARRLTGRGSPGSRASGDLTARERQVAELVADGLPNRTIAERLKLSNRTVEHHLASVFSKVDVRSRTELASLMARTASSPLP